MHEVEKKNNFLAGLDKSRIVSKDNEKYQIIRGFEIDEIIK